MSQQRDFSRHAKRLGFDCLFDAIYSALDMPVKMIQLGQVWRHDSDAQNYLVTKVYSEVFTQYAILRRADSTAATSDTTRVKIQKTSEGVTLPGYTFTQDSEEF